ncbi:hypothetical protein HZB00_01700 [Candidatus Woesearchaeota archaeon]|nr:hypothetical protein [Candidatus Woesearchaeota archaeon]
MGLIKSILSLLIVGVLLVVIAQSFDLTYTGNVVKQGFSTQAGLAQLDDLKEQYNVHLDNVPNFIKTLMKNEQANVEIAMNDQATKKLALTVEKGKIIKLAQGAHEKPTMKVWTTEKMIDEISNAEQPADALIKAIQEDRITYKALTFTGQAKVTASKVVVAVYSFWKGLKEKV